MAEIAELHRPYFRREIVFGRRFVCEWSPSEAWPDEPWVPDGETVIDGCEFESEAAAFDLDLVAAEWECPFDSWEQAVEWVLGSDDRSYSARALLTHLGFD